MATTAGTPIDDRTSDQPQPGAGFIQPTPDGREYWRRRALRAEAALRAYENAAGKCPAK